MLSLLRRGGVLIRYGHVPYGLRDVIINLLDFRSISEAVGLSSAVSSSALRQFIPFPIRRDEHKLIDLINSD